MNKWISLKETRKHDRYNGGGDWLRKGWGGLAGGGGALRNQQMNEKWESEIWAEVSARQLPRSTTNGR